jgi:phage/plasmid-associated DNA primase
MSRPTKLSKDIQDAICEALESGATYAAAAEAAGIAYSTFNEWMKDERPLYVKFSEAVRRSNARFMTESLKRIKDAGRRDWRALAWSLERRMPEHFGQQSKVDVTSGGKPLEIGINQIDYRAGLTETEE